MSLLRACLSVCVGVCLRNKTHFPNPPRGVWYLVRTDSAKEINPWKSRFARTACPRRVKTCSAHYIGAAKGNDIFCNTPFTISKKFDKDDVRVKHILIYFAHLIYTLHICMYNNAFAYLVGTGYTYIMCLYNVQKYMMYACKYNQ